MNVRAPSYGVLCRWFGILGSQLPSVEESFQLYAHSLHQAADQAMYYRRYWETLMLLTELSAVVHQYGNLSSAHIREQVLERRQCVEAYWSERPLDSLPAADDTEHQPAWVKWSVPNTHEISLRLAPLQPWLDLEITAFGDYLRASSAIAQIAADLGRPGAGHICLYIEAEVQQWKTATWFQDIYAWGIPEAQRQEARLRLQEL